MTIGARPERAELEARLRIILAEFRTRIDRMDMHTIVDSQWDALEQEVVQTADKLADLTGSGEEKPLG